MKKTKKSLYQVLGDKLFDNTLRYYAEYDYDRDYDCEAYGCDSICRCMTIVDLKITSIDIDGLYSKLANTTVNKVKITPIDQYCVDRILKLSNIANPDNWTATWGKGYYGDEVDDVQPDESIKKQILSRFAELDKITSHINKIKKLLEWEYGYLLPAIKNTTKARIQTVSINSVKLNNDQYTQKVSENPIDYKYYDLPRAICLKQGKDFKVIDGYNRTISAHQNNLTKIPIIVLS